MEKKMSKKKWRHRAKQTNTQKIFFFLFCNVICYGERKLTTVGTESNDNNNNKHFLSTFIVITGEEKIVCSFFIIIVLQFFFIYLFFSPFNKSRILSFVITLIFETPSSIMAQHHLEKSASVKLAVGKISKHNSLQIVSGTTIRGKSKRRKLK